MGQDIRQLTIDLKTPIQDSGFVCVVNKFLITGVRDVLKVYANLRICDFQIHPTQHDFVVVVKTVVPSKVVATCLWAAVRLVRYQKG